MLTYKYSFEHFEIKDIFHLLYVNFMFITVVLIYDIQDIVTHNLTV